MVKDDDGLIVKEQRIKIKNGEGVPFPPYYYKYEDSRLISYEETETGILNVFHWEDGDLMSYGQDGQAR